jgi:endonuclease YncB( thermonuclease family)
MVVGVSDGDTITVLDAERQQHKIRLSGIDAPEKAQPFGQRSKETCLDLYLTKMLALNGTSVIVTSELSAKSWCSQQIAQHAEKHLMQVTRR